jgi:hypothetical protein
MQTGRWPGYAGSRLKLDHHLGRRHLKGQPSSRTGDNSPYGMIGGIEETSASFEARSAPRSYPTKAAVASQLLLRREVAYSITLSAVANSVSGIVSPSAQRVRNVVNNIGCALCHTPQMQTAPVMNSLVLQDWPVKLFSDLLVHHMGAGLADDIIQGTAGPDEFRSTLLWGVGQRLFSMTGAPAICWTPSTSVSRSRPAPTGVQSECGDQQLPNPVEE